MLSIGTVTAWDTTVGIVLAVIATVFRDFSVEAQSWSTFVDKHYQLWRIVLTITLICLGILFVIVIFGIYENSIMPISTVKLFLLIGISPLIVIALMHEWARFKEESKNRHSIKLDR